MSNQDTNNTNGYNQAQGRRKSNFPALTSIPSDATLDFVSGSTNYKISLANFLAALGVTGTLEQEGPDQGAPVLDQQGAVNKIRNISSGSGVKAALDAENGITVEHNFLQDSEGEAILRDIDKTQPSFVSLSPGDGIEISVDGNELTISATGSLPATKVVTVNALDDFPEPVSNVISLEADTVYVIANNITTTARFILNDNTSIVGYSPRVAKLTSTNAGDMFTAVDSNVYFNGLRYDCPNGQAFNISETVGNTKDIQIFNSQMVSCQKFGTFTNMRAVSISNCNSDNCVDGITIAGSGWLLVSIDRLALVTASATFIGVDLGASVSDTVEINDLAAFGPAGSVGISGLANSGNITSGNLGTITNCNFLSDITPESGIDAPDAIRWQTSGNDGIADTRPDALLSMVGNATETVISTINTPVLVAGTFVVEGVSIFEGTTGGRATYKGERDFRAPIDFTTTVRAASGGTIDVTLYIAVNGAVLANSAKSASVSSSDKASITGLWQYTFQEDDYIEIFIENNTNTTNLVVESEILRAN